MAVRMSETSMYPCAARQGGWLIPNIRLRWRLFRSSSGKGGAGGWGNG